MKLVAYPLAALLALLGLMFVVGAQGQPLRVVVGLILMAAAGALVWMSYLRPRGPGTTVIQKIDLPGETSLQELTCKACGGSLSRKSLAVEAGAIFVHCEYCGAVYQLEEQPKW